MANETIIDAGVARRLLLILSLEGDVKKEEIEWALGIIHQIPGYAGITLAKAAQDKSLKDILVAIAAEQISPTTPKDLEALIEDAKKREAALKSAKETGEKRVEEFIEAAEKAAKTKAPTPGPETAAPSPPSEEPVSFGIKITPAALKAFSESVGKAAGTPFKLVSFFSPPRASAQAPQTTAALASAMSLSQISAKAEGLPEVERKQLLRFVENLRQAEFSFYAQVKLQRTPLPVQAVTILMGSEFGMTQGEVVALVHGGAPSEKGPSFIGRVGQQIFGGLAQKAVTKAATKAVTSALIKAGISITAKAGAAAAGTAVAPGVGTLIGLAVGWLVDKGKDLLSWVTRNAPKVAIGLGALLFGTGFVFQSPILMGTGGALAAGGFVGQAGGVGPALSQAGGFASSVISGITSLTVASIATPLIVALISIPVLVAVILFIINSGAYLVPPAELALSESPYILVEKIANPEGPFQNGKVPEITYTITIIPLRGSLTNIAFEYDCEVIKEGVAPNCPKVTLVGPDGKEVSVGKQGGLIISPTEPYKITYSTTYSGASFNDSAVIDTFTVTADSPEQKGAQASGSAVVIIGNPPTECFVFASGESDPKGRKSVDWGTDASGRANILGAIGQLARAPAYMTPLCVGGPIYLYRVPIDYGGGWASIKNGGSIFLYNSGVSSYGTAVYTLAHETGHITNWRRPSTFDSFRSQGISVKEGYLHTYPNQKDIYEDFAETIGLYVGEPFYHPAKWGDFSYENKYPFHYNFAKTLFGGVEY